MSVTVNVRDAEVECAADRLAVLSFRPRGDETMTKTLCSGTGGVGLATRTGWR